MNIYDIAEKAGCSIATVSRVMNNSGKVNPGLKEKILNIIAKENYIPNACARGLGKGSSDTIGIICANITNPFSAGGVYTLEHNLRSCGYASLLCCTGTNSSDKGKYLDFIMSKQISALILVGSSFANEEIKNSILEKAEQIPTVLINGEIKSNKIYNLCSDEDYANANNIMLLKSKGYNRIVYIHDDITFSGKKKLDGYKKGLADAGLPYDDELVIACQRDIDAARDAIENLFTKSIRFDAIIASEDFFAIAIQSVLRKHDYLCPLISFNNDMLSELASPSITSIDLHIEEMCELATQIIVKALDNDKPVFKPITAIIPSEIVYRESFS